MHFHWQSTKSRAQLHAHNCTHTHIKHKWHMPQVGSTSQHTCSTIASIRVNSLLLKKPYSGRVQDSTKINVSCESAMIEIHYYVRISKVALSGLFRIAIDCAREFGSPFMDQSQGCPTECRVLCLNPSCSSRVPSHPMVNWDGMDTWD